MNHNFESYQSGATAEFGIRNRSQCTICGLITDSYGHGNWTEMDEAIAEVESKFPTCEEFEAYLEGVE